MRDVSDMSDQERVAHRAKFGGYNDFPPNWKSCDPDEFWGLFMSYSADVVEFRQMMNPASEIEKYPPNHYGQRTIRDAKLYFYHGDVGVAMVQNYDYGAMRDRAPLLYKFAVCEHDYSVPVPEKSRMCYTVTRCSRCGHERAVDSND